MRCPRAVGVPLSALRRATVSTNAQRTAAFPPRAGRCRAADGGAQAPPAVSSRLERRRGRPGGKALRLPRPVPSSLDPGPSERLRRRATTRSSRWTGTSVVTALRQLPVDQAGAMPDGEFSARAHRRAVPVRDPCACDRSEDPGAKYLAAFPARARTPTAVPGGADPLPRQHLGRPEGPAARPGARRVRGHPRTAAPCR